MTGSCQVLQLDRQDATLCCATALAGEAAKCHHNRQMWGRSDCTLSLSFAFSDLALPALLPLALGVVLPGVALCMSGSAHIWKSHHCFVTSGMCTCITDSAAQQLTCATRTMEQVALVAPELSAHSCGTVMPSGHAWAWPPQPLMAAVSSLPEEHHKPDVHKQIRTHPCNVSCSTFSQGETDTGVQRSTGKLQVLLAPWSPLCTAAHR